jgi:hypothetical protein
MESRGMDLGIGRDLALQHLVDFHPTQAGLRHGMYLLVCE